MQVPRSFRSVALAWALFWLLLPALATPAAAQELALKPLPEIRAPDSCPQEPSGPPPSREAMQQAERRASEATRAALTGDADAAREMLLAATELDPTAPQIAYRLARLLDEAGDGSGAVRHYCRYLRLTSDSPEAAEVRSRVERLAPPPPPPISPEAITAYRGGIRALEHGVPLAAVDSFTAALRSEPRWAAAYYNRAVSHMAAGATRESAADLRRYLELAPDAPDRERVVATLQRLQPPPALASASSVLVTGIALPGSAQFRTGRPVIGAAVMAGVGSALAIGFLNRTIEISCLDVPENGHCPPEAVLDRRVERQYLMPGVAVAAALTALAAWEGYRTALRRDGRAASDRGTASGSASAIRDLAPRVGTDGSGLRLEWLLRF